MDKKPLWLWSRISSVKWEDAWEERLRFLPPGSCALLSSPGSRALRIKAYTNATTAKKLTRYFGGSAKKLDVAEWNKELHRETTPLRVRGRLIIFSEKDPWNVHRKAGDTPPSLLIPASMAFGTGSHPTTAGCLRLLADEAQLLNGKNWHLADLGTGSGILALAAKKLGAEIAHAFDYDAVCVKIARLNAKTNRLLLEEIKELDVHDWKPEMRYDIVSANLFSNTLISAAGILADAIKPGGMLIFSGVLREQLPEVSAALTKAGFASPLNNPRGKWVFGKAEKIAQ